MLSCSNSTILASCQLHRLCKYAIDNAIPLVVKVVEKMLLQAKQRKVNVPQDVTKQPPSQKVLETAKAQTLNSFVFNFANTNTQLQRILIYSLLGLPQDYLFQYKAGIEKVTSEDVRNAASRHLHPEQQIVVIAADKSIFEAPLTDRFGQVEPLVVDS